MDCIKAIENRRSIRKFKRKAVPEELLKKMVKCGSMAASGMNMQPVKYVIAASEEKVAGIFEHTRWAGYLKGEGSPSYEERPGAFILVYNDKTIRESGCELDAGAAVQNMLLAACSEGLATCWLGAIDRDEICKIAGTDKKYELISAIAVGYPAQKSIAEPSKGDIKYYLDKQDTLHVPKRTLDEVILSIC